ncbi:MAG: hypothetical protein JWN14_3241, partial [Chthonomonadales bacterium]|nr:hypothetical protein [Chthonomonadales bacterium]
MQPFILFAPDSEDPSIRQPQQDPGEMSSSILIGKSVVVVEDEGVTQMQLRR